MTTEQFLILLVDFIFSMKWILILLVAFIWHLADRYFDTEYFKASFANESNALSMDYKEEEITAHLSFIISEALTEYQLLQLSPKQITYINNKLQAQILEYMQNTVPDRISNMLYSKLGIIYNTEYVGEYIGMQIYLHVTEFVINFNTLGKNNNE